MRGHGLWRQRSRRRYPSSLVAIASNALLALGAAAVWGGGDFSGGMGVRRAGGTPEAALRVVLLSHATSFSGLVALAVVRGDPFSHGAALVWGLGAGVAGGIAIVCFYLALARGAMGASAAVSGLLAAAIPAGVTLLVEGTPGGVRLAGFALAGAAIWLIAVGPRRVVGTGTTWLAATAGAGFGVYFVGLKMAGAAGVVWPLAISRVGSLTVCGLMLGWVLARKRRGTAGGEGSFGWVVARWAVTTAVLDTSGNLLFVAATRAGRLDVAAVLASLYPASTILLAAAMLGERPTRRQGLGMAVAAVAVAMIAL